MTKLELISEINKIETENFKNKLKLLKLRGELESAYSDELIAERNKIVGKAYKRVNTDIIADKNFANVEMFMPIVKLDYLCDSIKCLCLIDNLDGDYGVAITELPLWDNENHYSKSVLNYEVISHEIFISMLGCYIDDLLNEVNKYDISK